MQFCLSLRLCIGYFKFYGICGWWLKVWTHSSLCSLGFKYTLVVWILSKQCIERRTTSGTTGHGCLADNKHILAVYSLPFLGNTWNKLVLKLIQECDILIKKKSSDAIFFNMDWNGSDKIWNTLYNLAKKINVQISCWNNRCDSKYVANNIVKRCHQKHLMYPSDKKKLKIRLRLSLYTTILLFSYKMLHILVCWLFRYSFSQ